MHETGTKGAVHSGLSIDDGNGIYQQMESRKLVSESRLDRWFIKMDGLDRDDIGLLDKRVTRNDGAGRTRCDGFSSPGEGYANMFRAVEVFLRGRCASLGEFQSYAWRSTFAEAFCDECKH
uniref:Uncharacterized protein n=1 Tax=Hyaloperonospora arabidopsidis (strain Emoy2) TaxID=559515 RepID=M4BAK2_HYAAE